MLSCRNDINKTNMKYNYRFEKTMKEMGTYIAGGHGPKPMLLFIHT